MDFSILENRLGVKFQDRSWLKQALSHRSYLNENRGWPLGHNERLEFLGDAVLELIVTDYLFRKYPRKPEGELTEHRSALVNMESLSTLATNLGMNDFLLLSRGETKDRGRARTIILGNAFEAVIGALYLDQGYAAADRFVTAHLLSKADEIIAKPRDAKSRLQEIVQSTLRVTPTYQTLEATGPDHGKQFVVGVYFGLDLVAKGNGLSKRRAEEDAAQAALTIKGWDAEQPAQ